MVLRPRRAILAAALLLAACGDPLSRPAFTITEEPDDPAITEALTRWNAVMGYECFHEGPPAPTGSTAEAPEITIALTDGSDFSDDIPHDSQGEAENDVISHHCHILLLEPNLMPGDHLDPLTLEHELGHCLDLHHSQVRRSIMHARPIGTDFTQDVYGQLREMYDIAPGLNPDP